jgi:hypothetical protein
VVHGHGGLDEASLSGVNELRLVDQGTIRSESLDPASLGLTPGKPLAVRKRAIASTTYEERLHRAPIAKVRRIVARQPDLEWVPLADLPFAALSGPHLRWITELAAKAATR